MNLYSTLQNVDKRIVPEENRFMPYANKERLREYNKEYHLKNWASRKPRHQQLKQARRIKLAKWLEIYKKNLFCNLCKEHHPACLDFHHIDSTTKTGTISNMVSEGYSALAILNEINKCIVLCKNCHAKKHYNMKATDELGA